MRSLIISLTLILASVVIFITVLKPEYKSAFEADQECHFEKAVLSIDSSSLGCDHDLETRQWILFDFPKTNQKAEILRRFRY